MIEQAVLFPRSAVVWPVSSIPLFCCFTLSAKDELAMRLGFRLVRRRDVQMNVTSNQVPRGMPKICTWLLPHVDVFLHSFLSTFSPPVFPGHLGGRLSRDPLSSLTDDVLT